MRATFSLAALLIGAVLALMFFERGYIENLSFAETKVTSLQTTHQEQLDLFVEQANLLTTLASALLAGLAAALLKSENAPIPQSQLAFLLAAVMLSGASLYFGYLAYQEVLWMLHSQFFNLEEPHVAWVRRLQFFSFLSSALFSLLFVAAWVSTRPSAPPKAH